MHEMKEGFALLQGLTLTYSLKVKACIHLYHSGLDGLTKNRSSVSVLFNLTWLCILSVYNMWVLPGNHFTTVSLVTEIFKMLAFFVCL